MADTITYEDAERITVELVERVIADGRITHRDRQTAQALLADPSLDFKRGDALSIATLIAIADGDWPEATAYLAATTGDERYRYGMRAQAESRIFGYLDARGLA